MLIIESYGIAVILLIVTMLCWGSWANTLKLAPKSWPFQLYYWDYTLGVLLFAIVLAFTAGSMGVEGRGFVEDLQQASNEALGLAFLGGIIFNLANLLVVVAIDIAGMAVAFPIAIGLALVIGVVVNYLATPLGDPVWLFIGVALVVVAIVLDALAYRTVTKGTKKLTQGIVVSIIGGILMGYFYRFVAASMASSPTMPEAGLMTNYTAVVVFAVGIFASNFIWNTILMYRPIEGEKVSYASYFKGSLASHFTGLTGGIIWCMGMSFSLMAASAAGFAISYGLGQGATMVAAAWGVFIWKEFSEAPRSANKLIMLMFLSFIAGLILIIYSRIA